MTTPTASRVDDPAARKAGTFSYLPPMSREDVARQVEHALARDWTCAVEHVEPARAGDTYWYLWKLPFFGAASAADVLAEVDACHEANPRDHVRLVALDRTRQTQGLSLVVHRAPVPPTPR